MYNIDDILLDTHVQHLDDIDVRIQTYGYLNSFHSLLDSLPMHIDDISLAICLYEAWEGLVKHIYLQTLFIKTGTSTDADNVELRIDTDTASVCNTWVHDVVIYNVEKFEKNLKGKVTCGMQKRTDDMVKELYKGKDSLRYGNNMFLDGSNIGYTAYFDMAHSYLPIFLSILEGHGTTLDKIT